ncbi:hypothetical protein K7W42_02600 [Deinococcus sp. HMF7604]|uniref:hypothetical protein n=1 Tax=Deinococcus betulae TaxID=2873312 RepID=UPI001CCF4D16|nr:hypothetical protein [Deinococcus betulae]MBZ9749749.1 hypothetical protein [Deinococcus betulae]
MSAQIQFLRLLIAKAQRDDVNLLQPGIDFQFWLVKALFITKNGNGRVSQNTARWRLQIMTGLYTSLQELGIIEDHPLLGMGPIPYVELPPRDPPLLPRVDLARVFLTLQSPLMRVVFLLAYEHQWRAPMVWDLKWKDVDLIKAQVRGQYVSDRLLLALQAIAPDGLPLFRKGVDSQPVILFITTTDF